MYQKILLPLDGSDCSNQALEQALNLAKHFGSELHLLYAVEDILTQGYLMAEVIAYRNDIEGELRRYGQKVLDDSAAKVESAGVKCQKLLVEGRHPVDAIVESEDPYDLIVIATHGRRGFNRMLLGSVTEGVLRRSSKPHLIIRCNTNA
ncbi:MAG: universal stress protein [Deinococcales bacterium]